MVKRDAGTATPAGLQILEYSSVVEQLSYTQRVPGSIPGIPITPPVVYLAESITADGRLIITFRRIMYAEL